MFGASGRYLRAAPFTANQRAVGHEVCVHCAAIRVPRKGAPATPMSRLSAPPAAPSQAGALACVARSRRKSRLSASSLSPNLTLVADRARSGSSEAVEHLVAATRDDVRRFIATLTDPGYSEELTQETFVRALRGLPRFAGQSSVLTWLFTIARHTVVDRYRSAAARPTEVVVTDWEAVPRSPGACGRFDELLALTDLIHHLSTDRRDVFVATQVQGYTYAEVAQATGLPIGTVRSRVARARAELAASVRAAEAAA